MILAQLSELHLGFRGHGRTERDRDARERDVAGAFLEAVREIVRLAPDLVVMVGDVFDRPDPAAGTLLTLVDGIDRLRRALSDVPIVVVAGPRDTPLEGAGPSPLALLERHERVEVAVDAARSLRPPGLDIHLLLLPYAAMLRGRGASRALRRAAPLRVDSKRGGPGRGAPATPELEGSPPTGRADAPRWNVLVAYGEPGGAAGPRSSGPRRTEWAADARPRVPPPDVHVRPSEWNWLALGGSHSRRQVGTRSGWAGSLERVGPAPWDEVGEEKGFLTIDLVSGRTRFHAIPVRPVVALGPVRATPRREDGGDGGADLRARLRAVVDEVPGGIEGKIVRVPLRDAGVHELLSLQGETLTDLGRRALHLVLEPGGRTAPPRLPGGADLRLRGDDPALGRIDVRVPAGMTAVVSDDPAAASRLVRWVAGRASRADGAAAVSPDGALDDLCRRLSDALRAPKAGVGTGLEEGAVGELRAEHAEVAGDLEAANVAWMRERQDAETHLRMYRDRALELKSGLAGVEDAGPDAPCPTCGRPLADHRDDVLGRLREEYESVVQDGSWWRRRMEQLELRPDPVRALEARERRLRAALEDVGPTGPARPSGVPAAALLDAASAELGRITGGRLLAVAVEGRRAVLHAPGGPLDAPADEDLAVATVALRIAAADSMGGGADGPMDVLAIDGGLRRLRAEDLGGVLDRLASLLGAARRIVLALDPVSAGRRRERFDRILRIRTARGGGAPVIRELRSGPARLRLAERAGEDEAPT